MMNQKFLFTIMLMALLQMIFSSSVSGSDFSIVDNPVADSNPAVAYNATNDEYLVVVQVETGLSNHDIYARIIDSSGTLTGYVPIATDSKSEINPKVVYNSHSNEYLIVFEYEYSITDHHILAQRLTADGNLVGGVIVVTQTNSTESNPDVVYNAADNQYLIAWEQGANSIYGQVYSNTGFAASALFQITQGGSYGSAPSVTYDSTHNRYLVLWHYYFQTTADIQGCLVTNSGSPGSIIDITTNAEDYIKNTNAKAAWNPLAEEYLIVFEERRTYNESLYGIQGVRVTGSCVAAGQIFKISKLNNYGYTSPDVTYNALKNEYLVSYVDESSPTNHDIYCRLVMPDNSLPWDEAPVAMLASNESNPALTYGKGTTNLIVWQDDRNGTAPDIYGELLGKPLTGIRPANSINPTTSTLFGHVFPTGADTTYYFEYYRTIEYIFTTPVISLGSGIGLEGVSATIFPLLQNSDYHFRLKAQNKMGESVSNDLMLSTMDNPPAIVTASAATDSSGNTVFNGSINPNGTDTLYYFEYGISIACDQQTTQKNAGSGTENMNISETVTDLLPNQTYYFRLVGICSSVHHGAGTTLTFTTPAILPGVQTTFFSDSTPYEIRFNGTVDPNGSDVDYYFQWGLDTQTLTDLGNNDLTPGHGEVQVNDLAQGMSPGSNGVFRLVAENTSGTSYGDFQPFSTPLVVPAVSTQPAAQITTNTAKLNGKVNPHGAATTYRFEYWLDPQDKSATPWDDAGSGNSDKFVSVDLINLEIDKTYSFNIEASNSAGTTLGDVLDFDTLASIFGDDFEVVSGINAVTNPAVVYNSTRDEYLVVCQVEVETEPSKYDIYARIINSNGSLIKDVAVATADKSELNPTIAYNSYSQEYLVVFEYEDSTTDHHISAQRLGLTGNLVGDAVTIAATGQERNPDVVCNSADNQYLIAWEMEVTTGDNEIWGQICNADTSPAASAFSITTQTDSAPSVTYNSSNNQYLVLFNLTNSWTRVPCLAGQVVTSSGELGTFQSIYCNGLNARAAWNSVANEYLVVFEASDFFGKSIKGQRLTGSASLVESDFEISGSEQNEYGYPDVAYNTLANEYLVTYSYASSPTNFDIYLRQVSPDTSFLGNEIAIAVLNTNEPHPAVASGSHIASLIVWQDERNATPPDIYGELLPLPPQAGTRPAVSIGPVSFNLYGQVLPKGETTYYFEYGTTIDYGSTTPIITMGTGGEFVDVSASVFGLDPNTIYHFRIVAQNGMGQTPGNDQILSTMDDPPIVNTTLVATLDSGSAVLQGSINPNGIYTTYYFEYGTSAACNQQTIQKFASSGTSSIDVSEIITNLLPNQKYYFRLVGIRDTALYGGGSPLAFVTPAIPPDVQTSPPTDITPNQVRFNGTVNPNGSAIHYYFQWGVDAANLVDLTGQDLDPGSGEIQASYLMQTVFPGMTGVFRLAADNTSTTRYGSLLDFSIPPVLPVASTQDATLITSHTVSLQGKVNPGGAVTNYRFQYWFDPLDKLTTDWVNIGSGNDDENVTADLINLEKGRTYSFFVEAQNSVGSHEGDVLEFDTPAPPPLVITYTPDQPATSDSIPVSGSVNPNGTETDYWFKYWVDGEIEFLETGHKSAGSGNTAIAVSEDLKMLIQGKEYKYQLMAQNMGKPIPDGEGTIMSFTTLQEQYTAKGMWPNTLRPWYFSQPRGIESDGHGNVYIADTYNHRIQKFTSEGHLSKAWGKKGGGNGEFNHPMGIARDLEGFIYVADTYNYRIQKFTPDGTWVTQWDCPASGEGVPFSLDVSRFGDVYVCIAVQNGTTDRIQRFTKEADPGQGYVYVNDFPSGEGSGIGEVKFDSIGWFDGDIAIQKECATVDWVPGWGQIDCSLSIDRVYVADFWNNRIQRFDLDGSYLSQWDGGSENPLHHPNGVALTQDFYRQVYVLDSANDCIKIFGGSGNFVSIRTFPSQEEWPNFKKGITVDKSGSIYLTNASNTAVQKLNNGSTRWAGNSSLSGAFDQPEGICLDSSGNIYVADTNNHRIQKFNEQMEQIGAWYKSGTHHYPPESWFPKDIAISSDNKAYIIGNDIIQIFDLDGGYIEDLQMGTGYVGICIDSNNYIYLMSYHHINKISPDGLYIISQWIDDGNGRAFSNLTSIACDVSDNIYITDADNHRVVKMSSGGNFLAEWGSLGELDGQFMHNMRGITIGSDGFVYVADSYNHRIQKFTTDGRYVTQFGGHGFTPGKLSIPKAVKLSNDGTKFYVADTQNHRIQLFEKRAQGTNNKAIILAGGGNKSGNVLWKATKVTADLAAWVLGYQGFGSENIQYLSAESENNPFAGELIAATRENLQTAIESWASDATSLTIHLTDHGGHGTFRINETDILTAEQLNIWLETLQNQINIPVTVIIDACYSGTFSVGLAADSGKQRIVITSSGPDEVALFAGQGWLSFSTSFWMNIFKGKNVQEAFNEAFIRIQRIAPDQHPVLAPYNLQEPIENYHIGNGILSQDVPTIGSAGVEGLSDNSATLYASNIQSSHGISRVWAVVIPPLSGFMVQGKPILDFPQTSMEWSETNTRWEGLFEDFIHSGTYRIMVYAMDRNGATSIPHEIEAQMGPDLQSKALIILGGSTFHENFAAFKTSAQLAYQALKWQGYPDENIEFFSPEVFEGTDDHAIKSVVQAHITFLRLGADTKNLVLYMVGPGKYGGFRVHDEEEITPLELSNWLGEDLKTAIIYDADFSGSFIPDLSHTNRTIVTSTSAIEKVHIISEGEFSFSRSFWAQVLSGANIWNAYGYAKNEIQYLTGHGQKPELDDDGDGICCGPDDGIMANGFIIGAGIQMAPNEPLIAADGDGEIIRITEMSPSPLLQESVSATGALVEVSAEITSPGYGNPNSYTRQSIQLTHIPDSSIYEGGDITDFGHYGYYNIGVFARDGLGNVSDVKKRVVFRADGEDIFEADDVSADSSVIFTNGSVQRHNFHDSDSQDWIKFYANADKTYEVQIDANTLEPECSPVIILYDMDGSTALATTSGTAPLSWPGTGVSINEGFYYIRVTNDDGDAVGVDTGYDISIHRTDAGDRGELKGHIFDLNYAVVAGSLVTVILTSSTDTTPVFSDGYYSMDIPAGTWPIKATAPGGLSSPQGQTVTIRKDLISVWSEFISLAVVKGDIDGDNDVDNDDANLVLDVLTGKNPADIRSNYATSGADVNGDNVIGPEELIYILGRIQ